MAMTMQRGAAAVRAEAAPRLTLEGSARARAFRKAARHTLFVRLLRLALPLGTAGFLAFWGVTLGVGWRLGQGHLRIGEVAVTADDLTMKNPSYFGQTKDGGHYEVRAKKAVVEINRETPIKLIDIDGDLVQTNAVVTKLKAKHGLLDNVKNELELFDGIEIAASSGLKARLARAMIYAKENRIVSNQPVDVSTPTGRVTGAAMTMRTDTHEATFVGHVTAHLVAASAADPAGKRGTAQAGGGQQAVDVTSDNLYVNDATKSAVFMGSVVATRGDTRLRTPELHVAYEGKGAQELSTGADAADSHLSRLLATSGCVLTLGTDRRITSDQADFDAKADTALFTGNVLINQQRNVLQGQRLFVDRKAGKSRLDAPPDGAQPAGRIAATFFQTETRPTAATKNKRADALAAAAGQGNVFGSFKADPNAPIDIEADTLDVYDATKEAVFRGNVKSQQGEFIVRTVAMTAFYAGQSGFGLTGGEDAARPPAQLTRVEAREQVLIKSKDGQTATGDWAIFDVKANSVLLGDHVVVSRGKDVAQGPRLKIDLTTGMYRFELEAEPASLPATSALAPQTQPIPAADPTTRACPPGKQCLLFYPKDAQDKAKEKANEKTGESAKAEAAKAPAPDGRPHIGWEPSNSASPVLRND